MLNALAEIFNSSLQAQNLFGWLDLPASRRAQARGRAAPESFGDGIRFEGVDFAYTGGKTVLQDIQLHLKPGHSVALVGENGAGKTTLVKLLTGLYTPTAGRILVDGQDLTGLDPEAWRDQVAVCFQDFVRFQLTAGENIGLGRADWIKDQIRIAAAAEATGADGVVAALAQSYDKTVGSELGGRELSGGQWQKLAVARTFLRDAPVVVMDEPSAALDPKAEAVLDQGRIVEEGTHEELLHLNGEYARMYKIQAQWYQ